MPGAASMTLTDRATAEPRPSGRYCLGIGPGARAPLPAAKIKAAVFTGALDNGRRSIHSSPGPAPQRGPTSPGAPPSRRRFALAKPVPAGYAAQENGNGNFCLINGQFRDVGEQPRTAP